MTVSLDEFRRRTRESTVGQERIRDLRAAAHEGLRATAVTGHSDWDHYLSALEARIKIYSESRAAEQLRLCDPAIVNGDAIMASKVKIACLTMAVSVLEEAIVLPKLLIEAGEDAATKLKAIEPKSE